MEGDGSVRVVNVKTAIGVLKKAITWHAQFLVEAKLTKNNTLVNQKTNGYEARLSAELREPPEVPRKRQITMQFNFMNLPVDHDDILQLYKLMAVNGGLTKDYAVKVYVE